MHSVTTLPEYSTEKFSDIYNKASEFLSDYHNIGITPVISDSNASLLFYLLFLYLDWTVFLIPEGRRM